MVFFSPRQKDGSTICAKTRVRILYLQGAPSNFQTATLFRPPTNLCTMKTPCGLLLILAAFAPAALFALALALPPTSDLSPTPNDPPHNLTTTTNPPSNSLAHCFRPTSPFTLRKPRFTDCGAAIRRTYNPELTPLFSTKTKSQEKFHKEERRRIFTSLNKIPQTPLPAPLTPQKTCTELPSNHIIGIFHTAGTPNQFQLPLLKTSGSCTVTVKMQSGFSDDTSTWLGVGAAASQLNMACVSSFGFPVKIGGWTTAGRLERINILLHFSGTRDG